MGSNIFVADPEALHAAGVSLENNMEEFRANYKEMFRTVKDLVDNDYIDPAARAIANDIFSYYDQLEYMAGTMGQYAQYCNTAERKTVDNQSEIISNIDKTGWDA